MFREALPFIGLWLAAVSGLAVILALRDKRAARGGKRRVSERTLWLVCALGGSAAMLAAMRAVRHKTRQARFMAGIPVLIALQTAVFVLAWWRFGSG